MFYLEEEALKRKTVKSERKKMEVYSRLENMNKLYIVVYYLSCGSLKRE